MESSGNTVLITGGGSGIGLCLAQAFKEAGSKVIITGRDEAKLKATGWDFKVADVTKQSNIEALYEEVASKYGGINILVNNAGIFNQIDYRQDTPLEAEEQFKEVDTNYKGPIRLTQTFLPQLKKKPKAAIVNVSSGLAFVPLSVAPVYCGTKAAIHSWTRSLRYQLAHTNIKVFELMPPLVDTPMVTAFKGAPMMEPEKVASTFMAGFAKDKFEITPGQSSQLKFMSRAAPGFIFKMVNKQFSK